MNNFLGFYVEKREKLNNSEEKTENRRKTNLLEPVALETDSEVVGEAEERKKRMEGALERVIG